MLYRPLIIDSEFRAQVRLGANVGKNNELDPFIRDFQITEFEPLVSDVFYSDITGDLSLRPELQSFLDEYIKPYLIYGTYEKFLLWHGRNVSQFGLRQNNEDTSEAISDKARGELMADARGQANIYLNKMNRQLLKVNHKFDSVTYEYMNYIDFNRGKPNTGIKQVGAVRNNPHPYRLKRGEGYGY